MDMNRSDYYQSLGSLVAQSSAFYSDLRSLQSNTALSDVNTTNNKVVLSAKLERNYGNFPRISSTEAMDIVSASFDKWDNQAHYSNTPCNTVVLFTVTYIRCPVAPGTGYYTLSLRVVRSIP